MVTTDLGACEWFLWDLRRSNLLDRGQLDQLVGSFLEKNPRAEPPELAEYLVAQGILTPFQADRLLQGKTQGFVLGPYVLMDALGQGSMGTVYRAESKNDGKTYAVKVLPRRSMWNVRIARRKVRVFEECKHPAVVPFVDVGTSGGMHYLAWPFVPGETLDKVVAREGKLPPGTAAKVLLQVAEGLEVCHAQGLFHGLLKPGNLMVGPDQQVYILDLGIGALLAETEGESLVDTMSTANSVASGLDCASPESIMDPTNLTPLGDQYSLGCVLYYCLTGQFPFPDGTAAEKMIAQQTKQPVAVRDLTPGVPTELALVVERLLQKSPANRYATTGELIEALRPLAGDAPALAPAMARPAPAAKPAPAPRPLAETPRPSSLNLEATPRPAARPEPPQPVRTLSRGPALPTRQSMLGNGNGVKAAPTRPAVAAAEADPSSVFHPAPKVVPNRQAVQFPFNDTEEMPSKSSWEEKLGPIGIAVTAIVVCAVAWLVTWKMF